MLITSPTLHALGATNGAGRSAALRTAFGGLGGIYLAASSRTNIITTNGFPEDEDGAILPLLEPVVYLPVSRISSGGTFRRPAVVPTLT